MRLIIPFLIFISLNANSQQFDDVVIDQIKDNGPWYYCDKILPATDSKIVKILDNIDHSFGDVNRRFFSQIIDLPSLEVSTNIALKLSLECPESGLCDHWDRLASIMIRDIDSSESYELARYITPYRRGMCTITDVTHLSPILQGEIEVNSFIDTYVGPGHESGDGWRLSAELWYLPSDTVHNDHHVISIYPREEINLGSMSADGTINNQLRNEFYIEDSSQRVIAHLTATGHGFGFTENCAEFCVLTHHLEINDVSYEINQWRKDCDSNPVSPQRGTWKYARNGWCPGAISTGDMIDISDAIVTGINTVSIKILLANGEEYINDEPTTNGSPNEQISLQLYVYSDS